MTLIISLLSFSVFILLILVGLLLRCAKAQAEFSKSTTAAISVIRLAFAQYSRRLAILEGTTEKEAKEEHRGVLQ